MSNENDNTKETEQRVKKIFFAVRSLPNGSIVKVEQSDTFNIRISVSSGDKSDGFVLTPQAAKTLNALLEGCLNSKV